MAYQYRIVKAMGQPITVIVKMQGLTKIVARGQETFDALVEAINSGADDDTILRLLDNKSVLDKILKSSEDYINLLENTEFEGEFKILYDAEKRCIRLNGVPMDNKLTRLILRYVRNNDFEKVGPLAMFLGRVMLNPSVQSRRDLFEFLQHNNYRLAADGRFYAWKSVRKADEKSHHSGSQTVYVDAIPHEGRIPNPDGAIISMDRALVDDNSGQAWGVGLHIGSHKYASKYGHSDILLKMVLVDPEHVVAVPRSESDDKMRTCQYEVVEQWDETKEYGLALL